MAGAGRYCSEQFFPVVCRKFVFAVSLSALGATVTAHAWGKCPSEIVAKLP